MELVALRPRKKAASRNSVSRLWLGECLADDRGRILPILANLLIALRRAPELQGVVGHNEMQNSTVLLKALPVADGAEGGSGPYPRPFRDTDASQLQEWAQHAGLPKIGREQVFQAVEQRADELRFHPVRAFLDGLVWDRKERLDGWLTTYLGAAPDAYASGIGAMFLTAMVARIFEPGCKSDHLIVLEGEQGAGKSRACRVLAGEYFSDSLPDIRAKDAAQHLRGKWLIEIAELSATSKADAEALKSFLSRGVEQYRPPFGRQDVTEPRQCVFVGTTNRKAYLKDETGARRFWPVKVGRIDIDGLERDREQLLAEAVEKYRRGAKWWPDAAFEREHIRPQQGLRFEADAWEHDILKYLVGKARVSVSEVARDALHMETPRIGTADQRRIAAVLTEAGWEPGRDNKGRFYQKAAP